MVQWLRLHASNARGMSLIPGQGTEIPHAMQHGQKVKVKIRVYWSNAISIFSLRLILLLMPWWGMEGRGTVLPLVSLESSLLTQTPQGLLPITGHSSDQPGPSRHIWLWPCRSRFGRDIHKALAFSLELWDLLIFRKGNIMLEFSRPSLIFSPLFYHLQCEAI